MGKRLGTLAVTISLASVLALAGIAGDLVLPSLASARAPAQCYVPSGERVAFRHGGALVTANAVGKSIVFYGCLTGVGRIFVIDRGSSTVGPENFVIAGNYLSFVQVSSPDVTGVSKMSIEQWNLRTGKRTLNPNTVAGVTYATVSAPPKFTASTRGYLAWVITTGLSLGATTGGPASTLTNLMVFDGHGASVADSFNSQTDTAPAGTILSGIFTNIKITGKVLSWQRLGQPETAPIG
jgi:hypothetical protein